MGEKLNKDIQARADRQTKYTNNGKELDTMTHTHDRDNMKCAELVRDEGADRLNAIDKLTIPFRPTAEALAPVFINHLVEDYGEDREELEALHKRGELPNIALERLSEYGLSFDYVAPDTFNDQPEGYFRWQLSWGGPSDEYRIYADKLHEGLDFTRVERHEISRIYYNYMDWFDGASYKLEGKELAIIRATVILLFDLNHAYELSMEENK